MIYHLLIASNIHHVPEMIKNILKYSDLTNDGGRKEHFFWLRKNKRDINDSANLYQNLFREVKHNDYCFIKSDIKCLIFLFKYSKQNKIIIHSNQSLYNRPLLFWFFIHYFLTNTQKKNMVQILWGLPMSLEGRNKSICREFLYKTQCKAMASLGHIVALTEEDFQKTKKFFNLNENVQQASYIYEDFTLYREILKSKESVKSTQIMIAHSAFPHNNHFKTFFCLKKFYNKDIKIICPLSYGTDDYRKNVLIKGTEQFGIKFIPYLELLPRENYNKLLSTIDIFINHAEVQTSLYVVYFCISTGIKMYLNKNNYDWLIHQGFKVNHVDELENISFEDLIRPLSQDWIEHNLILAKRLLSAEGRAQKWKLLYS